jgi:ABC-type amino acid transport substrate-binding protein
MWQDYELTMKMMADLEKKGKVRVLPETFASVFVRMALPAGSPLREPLDRALAKFIDTDDWVELKDRYKDRIH